MFLNSYKAKQGKIVRWGTFIASALLAIFAMYRVFYSFPYINVVADERTEFWAWVYKSLYSLTIPGIDITITVSPRLLFTLVLGTVLLLALAYVCFRKERTSDFLIDTESEMRKVAWPTFREVIDSSLVVIIVIVALGIYLFVVDIGLSKLFNFLLF